MNRTKLALAAALATALVGASSIAFAADAADSTRQERMDSAYQNYRSGPNYQSNSGSSMNSGTSANPNPGRFERAENSVKRGARKAGTSIKHGAQKVGGAVTTGATKARDAVRNTGEKIQEKVGPGPNKP